MRFTETPLHRAFVIDLDRIEDERGYFARTYDAGEFINHGLDPTVIQCNTSFNTRRGTLRGMHYQADPDGGRGVRFDDPAFGIQWPLPDPIVSERDRQYDDFQP